MRQYGPIQPERRGLGTLIYIVVVLFLSLLFASDEETEYTLNAIAEWW